MRSWLPDAQPVKRHPLRDDVYNLLKEYILEGKLRPGEKIPEQTVAGILSVSRTPIREALIRLEREGLVQVDPHKGASVVKLALKDIAEIYPIIAVLEGLAARLAAPRTSPADIAEMRRINSELAQMASAGDTENFLKTNMALHNIVLDRSANPRLTRLLSEHKNRITFFRLHSLQAPGRMASSASEHEAIIAALEAHDAPRAESLVKEHILHGEAALELVAQD